jgi:hypothetical protein
LENRIQLDHQHNEVVSTIKFTHRKETSMKINRRGLLKQGSALTTLAWLGANFLNPKHITAQPVAPELADLDLYAVYRKMFSSTVNDAECCWWYFGSAPMNVPGVGEVPVSQAETCMVYKTKDLGADTVKVYWKEIGIFRDIATGELPGPWINPTTGNPEPRRQALQDGPAHYTISRTSDGIHIDLDQAHASVQKVTPVFTVENGRVCITQIEDKIRDVDTLKPSPIQTVLKIYASLDDVKDPQKMSVKASGFYTAGTTNHKGSGIWAIYGLMQKAAVDEKLNPIAWERMRRAYPKFFKGNRVDPSWNSKA